MSLVPPEQCTQCNKNIGAKQVAYLWNGEIVCYRCHRALSKAKREKEEAEQAKWITEGQRDFFTGFGVNVPNKATRDDAQRAFDAIEHLRHFICGAWLNVSGRHIRECGVSQEKLKTWAAQMAFDKPTATDNVIRRVKKGGHADDYLKDIDTECYKLVEAAFLAFCKNTDEMQRANHDSRRCKGSYTCP